MKFVKQIMMVPALVLLWPFNMAMAGVTEPDSSFNGKGWVSFNGFRSYANYHDVPVASFIRSDGKLVVVGSSSNARVAISRLNTDGTLDTSFNTTGSLSIAASGGIVGSGAIAATLLPDNKIVVLIPVRNESGYENIGFLKLNEDGSIDTDFGNAGISMMPFSGGEDEIQCQAPAKLLRQSDGKFVISCRYNPVGGPDQMYLVRFNDDGTLDASFDSDGVVNTTLQGFGSGNFIQQADGKLVVVGQKPNGQYQGPYTAVRFNADGSLDAAFNSAADTALSGSSVYGSAITQQNDGRLVILGNAMIRLNVNGSRDNSFSGDGIVPFAYGNNVVEDAAHNLVTVGFTANNCYTLPPCPFNIRLTRVLPNGNLDASFGVSGVITLAGYTHFWAGLLPSLALQTDGKWLMTTTQANDANFTNDYDIRRFNSDGSVDTAFGASGVTNVNFGGYSNSTGAAATTALQQQNGKLVTAGWLYDANSIKQFGLVRYNHNGSLDTTFNGTGSAVATFEDRNSYGSVLTDLTEQSDGKLVAVGWTQAGTALVRFNADGLLDSSFNGDGKVITRDGLSGDIPADIGIGATPYSVIQQSDGKLVLGGTTYKEDGKYQMLLIRYNPDGSPDVTFNGTGFVSTPSGAGSQVNSVIQQSDGKLVAVGMDSETYCSLVIRYLHDGSLDASFNSQGVVCAPIGDAGFIAHRAIQQPDGKLIVGSGGNSAIQLSRYNSDGSLDANFGIQGVIKTVDIGGYYSAEVRRMYLQNNNMIMIVASAIDPDTGYSIGLLARFNVNGTVDEYFGSNGVHLIHFRDDMQVGAINAAFLQADGRFIAAGYATDAGSQGSAGTQSFNMIGNAEFVTAQSSSSSAVIAGDSMFVARFDLTVDTDADGLADIEDTDDDNDNMPDTWENTYSLNLLVDDAAGDPDSDGLTNLQEYQNATDPTVPDVMTSPCGVISDFDCNGEDDVLLRNPATGENVIWLLENGTKDSISTLTTNATTFDVAAILDGDGDGDADILWYDSAQGKLIFWQMEDGAKLANSFLGNTTATLDGVGDFDGDGDADILLKTALGDVKIWTIQNLAHILTTNVGTPAAGYVVVDKGDFNGDGIGDIVMQNGSGAVRIWQLNSSAQLASTINVATVASGYSLKKSGDTDNDGDDDLIFRNDVTGQTVVWVMQNGARVQINTISGLNPSMSLATVTDFDQDGDEDLMFRDVTPGDASDGDTIVWKMQDNIKQSNSFLGNNAVTFLLESALDMDGDGDGDILYRDSGTGQILGWNMEAGAKAGNYSLGNPGTNWEPRF